MRTPVPVVKRGAAEEITGLGLTFVVVTKRPIVASVIALNDLAPVGHLRWSIEDGELFFVLVDAAFRRMGVASVLWKVAGEVAEARGWPRLRHSDSRSVEGDAWARAVGGHLPPPSSTPRPYLEQTRDGFAELELGRP